MMSKVMTRRIVASDSGILDIPTVLIVLVSLVSGAVLIDSSSFDKAKVAYDKARYEDVVKLLRDGDLVPLDLTQRTEARFMLGVSELALNNDALSQKAFVALYTDDPDFQPPAYTAKKILAALDRAARQAPIVLEPSVHDGTVQVCGRGLPKKADVKVVFSLPEGEEGGPAIPDGRCFRQAVPTSGRAVGFYVVASVEGEVRATAGSRAQPLPLEAAKKEDEPRAGAATPWYKHWATWTIVGIVVVGGVAGGIAGGVYAANRPGTLNLSFELPPGAAR